VVRRGGDFREDVAWRPVALTVVFVIALTLLWRRTHPLAAISVGFGTLAVVDVARIFAAEHNGLLWSIAASLVLPHSLFRWGAGREAGIGLGVLLTWPAVTSVADPTGAAQVVGAFGFFLFSAAPVPVGLDSSASGWGSSSRRGAVPQPRPGNRSFRRQPSDPRAVQPVIR
jgi:hypothetical protein